MKALHAAGRPARRGGRENLINRRLSHLFPTSYASKKDSE